MEKLDFSRANCLPRVGRMDQLAAIRRYAIEDGKGRGMRAFEVVNSSGFDFTVYPDKGLDIGPARFNGLALAWNSRNGAVAPAFYDGTSIEWLRTWAGGLLTTCGLINAGGPCTTPEGEQGLHGRMDHTPAEEVNTRAFWNERGEYTLEITGKIAHTRVFGENLVTSRTLITRLGQPGFELVDRTENLGTTTSPLMQLYHMNLGWPLVDAESRLEASEHAVTPQNPYCAEHLADWNRFAAPELNFPEQVFYHDLPADANGYCTMRLVNPRLGRALAISFRKAELPYLIQWKCPAAGEYVTGLEPANCYPEGQLRNAERGILRRIEPGQVVETRIRVEVENTAGL